MRTPTNLLSGLLLCAVVVGCGDESPVAPGAAALRAPVAAASTATELSEGELAPDLSAFDVNGQAIALSDFAGSYVLLEVGAFWCSPSQFIAPFLPQVEDAIRADGIGFTSLSVLIEDLSGAPSDAADIQTWLTAFHSGDYRPVLHMNADAAVYGAWAGAVAVHQAIPVLFLIGPDGRVLRLQVGAAPSAEELEAWVREGIAQGGAPVLESIAGPTEPVIAGAPLTVTGTWSAPDEDVHTGTIDWGDGTIDPLVVGEDGTWSSPAHAYADIGFYRIEATISDDAGGSDSAVLQDVIVVDPDGGFVVGVGTVISPAESCFGCEDAVESPARFRLLSKYRKGASTPTGDFVFRFESGAFEFESTSQQWLLVNRGGDRAQLKGTGRIVGGPMAEFYPMDLHFMVWLDDGAPDGFALRIWLDDPAFGEDEIYDSFGSLPLESGNLLVNSGR